VYGLANTGGAFTTTLNPASIISVTATTGTTAEVILSAAMGPTSNAGYCLASFAVSGATTQAPTNLNALFIQGTPSAAPGIQASAVTIDNTLTAGSNTFTIEYESNSACNVFHRTISVIPLG
jgi:hypothetical protein